MDAWNQIPWEPPTEVSFWDVSQDAFGACVYLRWKTNGVYKSSLVASKSSVSLIKVVWLVRLELWCYSWWNITCFIKTETSFEIEQMFSLLTHKLYTARSINNLCELNANSIRQTGPTFLQEPVEDWPVCQSLWMTNFQQKMKVLKLPVLAHWLNIINP